MAIASNVTKFAGLYNAVDYAYGAVGSILPGALQVASGPIAAGAATLTIAYPYTTLPNSDQLFPLNTNAPITIGSGSNAETVTPSAVTNATSFLGNNTCTITATFSNAHGLGDLVASGTFGLQEAINAAAVLGGTVIVSGGWASVGGTNAMLATARATLPANVQILDNRTGNGASSILYGTIAHADVLTLNSVPISLIGAPGTGAMIDIIDAVLENVNSGVAYTGGGVIQLSYGTGVTTAASATIAATFLTSPTVAQSIKVAGALASTASSSVLNKAIFIACATADFAAGGTSTLKYRIAYNTLTGL